LHERERDAETVRPITTRKIGVQEVGRNSSCELTKLATDQLKRAEKEIQSGIKLVELTAETGAAVSYIGCRIDDGRFRSFSQPPTGRPRTCAAHALDVDRQTRPDKKADRIADMSPHTFKEYLRKMNRSCGNGLALALRKGQFVDVTVCKTHDWVQFSLV